MRSVHFRFLTSDMISKIFRH